MPITIHASTGTKVQVPMHPECTAYASVKDLEDTSNSCPKDSCDVSLVAIYHPWTIDSVSIFELVNQDTERGECHWEASIPDDITTIRFMLLDRRRRPVSWEVEKRTVVSNSTDRFNGTFDAGFLNCGLDVAWDSGFIPPGYFRLIIYYRGLSPFRGIGVSDVDSDSDNVSQVDVGDAHAGSSTKEPSSPVYVLDSPSIESPVKEILAIDKVDGLPELHLVTSTPLQKHSSRFVRMDSPETSQGMAIPGFRPVVNFSYPAETYHQFILDACDARELGFTAELLDEECKVVGKAFVSPEMLLRLNQASEQGLMNISQPVVNSRLEPIAVLRLQAVLVEGVKCAADSLSAVFRTYWHARPTLYVGHRGDGTSRFVQKQKQKQKKNQNSTPNTPLMENSIVSLQKAAHSGADYVEFDVQLDKEKNVVVHHDFVIPCIISKEVTMDLPIAVLKHSDLADIRILNRAKRSFNSGGGRGRGSPLYGDAIKMMEQARRVRMRRAASLYSLPKMKPRDEKSESEVRGKTKTGLDEYEEEKEEEEEGQGECKYVGILDRIPLLIELFEQLPPFIGFNIEIKHPMRDQSPEIETVKIAHVNTVVDRVLEVVFAHAKDRRVVFSSFHPEVCTLLSLKQPRYPVLFLSVGGTKRYIDSRACSLENAIEFAVKSHLQGVVSDCRPILKRPEYVAEMKKWGLLVFTYGAKNQDQANFAFQVNLGVDAIITDRVSMIAKANGKVSSYYAGPIPP